MEFSSKYISEADKAIDTKSTKTVISNDAYAIMEMLSVVAFKLGRK